MTENLEGKKESLNNIKSSSPQYIDRGVELLIRNKRRKREKPKTFQVGFEKFFSIFSREIHLKFNFFLDIRKNNLSGEKRC